MEQFLSEPSTPPTAAINIAEAPKNTCSVWVGPQSVKVLCIICSSLLDHVIRFVRRVISPCLTTPRCQVQGSLLNGFLADSRSAGGLMKSVQLKPARHCQVHVNSTQWCHSSSVFRGKPIGQRFVSSMSDPLGASAFFSNMYWYCPSAERVPSGPFRACL